MTFFVSSLFVISFIGEGLGINRNLFLLIYFCLPTLLSISLFFSKKKIVFPKKITLIFTGLLIMNFISLINAVNKENSLLQFLFYLSSFMIFLFFYQFKKEARRIINGEIILGTIIFILFFISSFLLPPLRNVQMTGYQLVKTVFGLHNHLGDFLGMTIVYLLFYGNYAPVLLISPFFVLSYSRSSYLALIFTLSFFWLLRKDKTAKSVVLSAIFLILLFWLVIPSLIQLPLVSKTLEAFHQTGYLANKELLSGRNGYLEQIKNGFLERPFFGFGGGNFGYVSTQHVSQPSQWTEVTHNIFLEELIGSGMFGAVFLLAFVFMILKRSEKKSPYFLLFLYLLINFQTDYTYKIYSVFILFIILSATIYDEKTYLDKKFLTKLFFGLSISVLIISSLIIVFFDQSINSKLVKNNLDLYLELVPFDNKAVREEGQIYEKKHDLRNSLQFYEKSYYLDRFDNLDLISKIYQLKSKLEGKAQAKSFVDQELNELIKVPKDALSKTQNKQIFDFCIDNFVLSCRNIIFRFDYFSEPDPKIYKLRQDNPQGGYHFNQDNLNDRFDYSLKKPPGIFRIVVVGSDTAFGLMVKTKDNWTERLEDLLGRRVQVINVAVDGYDIPYQVWRFERRGLKYQPDLVLWYVNNDTFYQFNEVMWGKTPLDIKAFADTRKEVGDDKLLAIDKTYLFDFRSIFSGPIVVISPYLSGATSKVLEQGLGTGRVYYDLIDSISEPQYNFSKQNQVNELGHQFIAKEVFNYLLSKKLIPTVEK